MQDLKITYNTNNGGNGEMIIHMDNFFPTAQTRLKKLLKIIALDYDHQEEHIETLERFFKEQTESLEEKRIAAGKKYLDYQQKVADTSRMVESKKKPSGVRLTKEELEQAKERLRSEKAIMSSQLSEHNRCKKKREMFLKHLEILEQRK